MNADNDLEGAAVVNAAEMLGVSSGRVEVLVLLDRIRGYSSDPIPGPGNFADARLLRVGDKSLQTVADWGEVDMGDPGTLAAFVEYGARLHPQRRLALVIWNHGAGYLGTSWDQTSNDDHLTLVDLAQALGNGLDRAGRDRIDLIGFDACLMASYEVAEAVRPFGRLLLASEELEPFHGWDYSLLGVLVQAPDLPAKDLALALMDGYEAEAKTSGTAADLTLSLVDLDALPGLTSALAALASVKLDPAALASVARSRAAADEYGETPEQRSYLVDLGSLARGFEETGPLGKARDAILAAVHDVVIESRSGPSHPAATGLSVYFPPGAEACDPTYGAVASAGPWRDFLASFLGAALELPPAAFVDPHGEAVLTRIAGGVLVEGTLAAGTSASVVEARLLFGVGDGSGGTWLRGAIPATLEGDSVFAFWDLRVPRVTQGTSDSPAFAEFEETAGGAKTASVALWYQETPDDPGLPATWVVGLGAGGLSSVSYVGGKAGAIGALDAVPGSTLRTDLPRLSVTGTTWARGPVTFDATEALRLEVEPLAEEDVAFVLLAIQDASGGTSFVQASLNP
jgi:hypothetical protein